MCELHKLKLGFILLQIWDMSDDETVWKSAE